MNCIICNKSSNETDLYEGIYEDEISTICEKCAELEGIPLIRKPNQEQINATEKMSSVKERLERLSGTRQLSKEQIIANKNLAKIKFPEKKQHSELLIDNYYWALKMARRRKKLTFKNISEATHIPEEIIEGLERGQLPRDFEETIRKLELFFNIKLLRTHELAPKFMLPERDRQERILSETKERMEMVKKGEIPETPLIHPRNEEGKNQIIRKIQRGKLDFSRRENLQNITLSDLQEMKRKRELKEQFEKEKQEHEDFFGDDLEVEEINAEDEE